VTWHQRELTLEDILSDPITKEVMKADRVNPHELSAMLKETARAAEEGFRVMNSRRFTRSPRRHLMLAQCTQISDNPEQPRPPLRVVTTVCFNPGAGMNARMLGIICALLAAVSNLLGCESSLARNGFNVAMLSLRTA